MALPSIMNKNFSKVPGPQMQRSKFRRDHAWKGTFDGGQLVPFLVDEVLPGQTKTIKANIFARLSTLVFPIMDNIHLDTAYFFVPNRLTWDNWEKFNGSQEDPGDSIDYEIPSLETEGLEFATMSLGDHFGLPVGVLLAPDDSPNALPFRAYNLIWNEWFRDQNTQDSAPVLTTDGPDPLINYPVAYRGRRHDYFTSCLPWPQKGDAVSIPLGTTAPVIGDGQAMGLYDGTTSLYMNYNNNAGFNGMLGNTSGGGAIGGAPGGVSPSGDALLGLTTNPAQSHIYADLSAATAATIQQLREAFALQQIYEIDARGGTRYVESLRAMWGVAPKDYRLQRPEYLGGSSERINVSAVQQTSSTDATSPQANLAAYSQVGTNSGFSKSFDEHGYIIGLVNVRTDITYQQGMRRMWSRRTRFDFYQPPLAHLGEQAVLNKEIYYVDTGTNSNAVFGYQERWAEYRYFPSQVTGVFRSNVTAGFTTLDAWHLALDFLTQPALNTDFITDNPPIDRVVAVETEPQVLMDAFIEYTDVSPMPVYSIPGLERL